MSIQIDSSYLIRNLTGLLAAPSPTGRAEPALAFTEAALQALGLDTQRTIKGALTAILPGRQVGVTRALTAHVDTLGAMVKEIKPNGRLKLTNLGGLIWNTVETEGCTIFTTAGDEIRGSLMLINASGHVYGSECATAARNADTLEVRLDQRVWTAADVRGLGIEVGDFVAFDPRVEVSPSGFIRSRFLDDKAGVASLLAAIRAMQDAGITPTSDVFLHISHYEEVGHGGADGLLPGLHELVAVDMAAIGDGQTSDEFHTTICVKDNSGPYHIELTSRLRALAQSEGIPHKIDIYPYYASDGSAYWRAGGAAQVALIGPGVDASHNYERTHIDSLVATAQLIAAYMCS
ncbi:MAG: M42 family metallopeptidase [Caldilineales bacterium]|nr:M42 family metallopeptidase [Caldilineales bacterium]